MKWNIQTKYAAQVHQQLNYTYIHIQIVEGMGGKYTDCIE